MTLFESIEAVLKLREIHRTVKDLYGEHFEEKVARWEPILRARAEKHEGNLVAAATEIASDPDITAQWRIIILAVAVELIERDKAKRNAPTSGTEAKA